MDEPAKVTAHYIKSPNFEEFPVHGVYGGVNQTGKVAMAIFSERMPIPTEIDLEITPVAGQLGAYHAREAETRGKTGVIRTVHAVLHMDLELAISLRDWLDEKVKTIRGGMNG